MHSRLLLHPEGLYLLLDEREKILPVLRREKEKILRCRIEADRVNSALPLLDLSAQSARIEPGAIIREQVKIGKNAVIMMGAILNIGAVVGEGTMIDMGAVLGGRATVGKNCHVGAGAVLAGVIEPASATPVIVEDNVLIGANAVVVKSITEKGVTYGGIPAKKISSNNSHANLARELFQ